MSTNINMKTMVQTPYAEIDTISDHPTNIGATGKKGGAADENRRNIAAKRTFKAYEKQKLKTVEKVLQVNSSMDNGQGATAALVAGVSGKALTKSPAAVAVKSTKRRSNAKI